MTLSGTGSRYSSISFVVQEWMCALAEHRLSHGDRRFVDGHWRSRGWLLDKKEDDAIRLQGQDLEPHPRPNKQDVFSGSMHESHPHRRDTRLPAPDPKCPSHPPTQSAGEGGERGRKPRKPRTQDQRRQCKRRKKSRGWPYYGLGVLFAQRKRCAELRPCGCRALDIRNRSPALHLFAVPAHTAARGMTARQFYRGRDGLIP